jgi:thiol-disulfide isomerase/thioredoxin
MRFYCKLNLKSGAILAMVACSVAIGSVPPNEKPSIESILNEVQAIGEPPFDAARKHEPGYLKNYRSAQHQLYRKKSALLLDLCRLYPDEPRIPEWMNRRWVLLGWNQDPAEMAAEVLADIDARLRTKPGGDVLRHALYWRAYFRAIQFRGAAVKMSREVRSFVDQYPDDERGARLLQLVADDESADDELRRQTYRRLAEQFPDTHYGKYAPGTIRRLHGMGQVFELSFTDSVSGRRVSINELAGKVVLIDFWATTCLPCVEELPKLKELYARVRERGVEFVGVSLDESAELGGLEALRRFVNKHEVPWPQYYQGNGYESDFSRSWGVGSAPTMFLLDKAGRLRFTDAGDDLSGKIEKLLAE